MTFSAVEKLLREMRRASWFAKKSELTMSRFIPLDNGSCWAQCFRHDVGSFFLANLAFPSQALSSLLVGSGFRGRVGPY